MNGNRAWLQAQTPRFSQLYSVEFLVLWAASSPLQTSEYSANILAFSPQYFVHSGVRALSFEIPTTGRTSEGLIDIMDGRWKATLPHTLLHLPSSHNQSETNSKNKHTDFPFFCFFLCSIWFQHVSYHFQACSSRSDCVQ